MTKLGEYGFSALGGAEDNIGDDSYVISASGRVLGSFNSYVTNSQTYGNGYYEINNVYGSMSGASITALDTPQPAIIIPTNSRVISFSASWYITSGWNYTGVEIGLVSVSFSGATRTVTQLGSSGALSGMNSTTQRYSLSHDIGVNIDKGVGMLPCIKRTSPSTSIAAYLNGFNIQILLETRTS